ncbi:MAG: glutaredoxin 3 [Candidatus Nucleicultricaceae bacterium]
MKPVQVYTTNYCPYCVRAKALLEKKGVAFEEIDLTHDDAGRIALVEKSGGRKTVPQIFIGDYHVGGCDDLYALDLDGKLDDLLKD